MPGEAHCELVSPRGFELCRPQRCVIEVDRPRAQRHGPDGSGHGCQSATHCPEIRVSFGHVVEQRTRQQISTVGGLLKDATCRIETVSLVDILL